MATKLEERVKAIIVDSLGVNADQVTPEASFVNDLGADSLDVMDLIMTLSDEFDMQVDDSEIGNLTTVGALVNYIESN